MLGVERARVGIRLARDLADADDGLWVDTRVVVEHLVAELHAVAHEIARGEIADTVPVRRAILRSHQIVEREHARLGLDEPVSSLTGRAWRECGGPGAALFLRGLGCGLARGCFPCWRL